MSSPIFTGLPIASESGGRKIAIRVEDLRVELGGVLVLAGVNVRIWEGHITAIIGPNGAGKTTLLLAILGMLPFQGRILIHAGNGDKRIGYVPQYMDFDRGMPVTVMDFLCMTRQPGPLFWRQSRKMRAAALESLARVQAGHLADRRLGNLSGGELQRVLLAQALLGEPSILLMDEPASAVDKTGEELLMKLIRGLQAERNLTLLMVSHDITMVTRLASQVICLNRSVLSEGKTADVINEQTLSACFGADKGLLLHDHAWNGETSCAYDGEDREKGGQ